MIGQKKIYYPFLDLLNEHQAIAQGARLSDKASYALYRAVQKNSSVRKANQNALFNLDMPVDGLVDMMRNEIISHLRILVDDRLVSQTFYLKYEDGKLNLNSCYFSLNSFDKPMSIFLATIRMSLISIDSMLKNLETPSIATVKSAFIDDFKNKKISTETYPELIINPFQGIKKENFDFLPPPSLIEGSVNEMRKELKNMKSLVEIENYGFMINQKANVLNYIEAAESILREEILSHYQKKNETLKNIVKQISLEESIHEIEPFLMSPTETLRKLGEAIKKVASRNTDSSRRYPGAFAVEVLIKFSAKADIFLRERLNEERIEKYKEYRERIFASQKVGEIIFSL